MQAFKIIPNKKYVKLNINVFNNISHWTIEEQEECSRRIIKQTRKYFKWLDEEDAMMDSLVAVQKAYKKYGASLTPCNVFGYIRKELATECLVKQRFVNAKAMKDLKKEYFFKKNNEQTVGINNHSIELEINDDETVLEQLVFQMDMESILPQYLHNVFEKKIIQEEKLSLDENKLYKEALKIIKRRYYD